MFGGTKITRNRADYVIQINKSTYIYYPKHRMARTVSLDKRFSGLIYLYKRKHLFLNKQNIL